MAAGDVSFRNLRPTDPSWQLVLLGGAVAGALLLDCGRGPGGRRGWLARPLAGGDRGWLPGRYATRGLAAGAVLDALGILGD